MAMSHASIGILSGLSLLFSVSRCDEGYGSRLSGLDGAPPNQIHVGPGGFATLEAVRGHLRTVKPNCPVDVVVHPGVYRPFGLSAADSGTPDARITWRSLDSKNPAVIDAGITIPNSAFRSIGQGPLVRADLYEHGVNASQLGEMVTGNAIHECQHQKTDLVFGGERMTLARWPNIAPDGGWRFANIDTATADTVGLNISVQPELSRVLSWSQEEDPWIHGYWEYDWTDSYLKVGNMSQSSDEITMTLLTPTQTPIKPNARFYGVNLLCELDMPGEYFVHSNGTMYFWPPRPLSQWQEGAIAFTANQAALNITGLSHHSFKELHVRNSQQVGVLAENVKDVELVGIISENHGTNGVVISGDQYTLRDSLIQNTGCVGVQATGGDTVMWTGGGGRILNNTVRKMALWKRTYMAGVRWGGFNNSYIGNRVSDGPHNCFLGGGNEFAAVGCLHENNTIQNCAYEASDTGAWYTCGQDNTWIDRGNVARGNLFKQIRCRIDASAPRSVEGCGGGVQAVYLDDQISGWHFESNQFEDCDTGFFVGGGRDNIAVNNTFFNCTKAVHLDNRGMNWEASECAVSGKAFSEVVSVTNGSSGMEWLHRFPALRSILAKDHLCVPVYNQIVQNSYSYVSDFIDATPAQYTSWRTTVEGNTNTTPPLDML